MIGGSAPLAYDPYFEVPEIADAVMCVIQYFYDVRTSIRLSHVWICII